MIMYKKSILKIFWRIWQVRLMSSLSKVKYVIITHYEINWIVNDVILFLTFYCELPTAITQNNRWFYRTFFSFCNIYFHVTTFTIPIWYNHLPITNYIMRLDKILPSIVKQKITWNLNFKSCPFTIISTGIIQWSYSTDNVCCFVLLKWEIPAQHNI